MARAGNPDRRAIEQIFNSRTSTDPAIRAQAPEAQDQRPFHFWFSTSSTVPAGPVSHTNFVDREQLVRNLQASSGNRLKTHFNNQTSIELQL